MQDLSNVSSVTITKEGRGLVLTYLTPATNTDGTPTSSENVAVFPLMAHLVQFLADGKFTA